MNVRKDLWENFKAWQGLLLWILADVILTTIFKERVNNEDVHATIKNWGENGVNNLKIKSL